MALDTRSEALHVTRDPLDLDKTPFALRLRQGKNPPAKQHPLRRQPDVATVMEVLERLYRQLTTVRRISRQQSLRDPYFQRTANGIEFRLEAVTGFTAYILSKNPDLLEKRRGARRRQLHAAARDSFQAMQQCIPKHLEGRWVVFFGITKLDVTAFDKKILKERCRSMYEAVLRTTGYEIDDLSFFKASRPRPPRPSRPRKKH